MTVYLFLTIAFFHKLIKTKVTRQVLNIIIGEKFIVSTLGEYTATKIAETALSVRIVGLVAGKITSRLTNSMKTQAELNRLDKTMKSLAGPDPSQWFPEVMALHHRRIEATLQLASKKCGIVTLYYERHFDLLKYKCQQETTRHLSTLEALTQQKQDSCTAETQQNLDRHRAEIQRNLDSAKAETQRVVVKEGA